MEIPCNNVQNFTLVHAHKPKFGLSLYTSFLLAGKVWTKSSVNPGKETLISSRCVGLFMHRFFTKNVACFFPISSVRMQSIYKMHSPLERSILALSVAYLKSWLTCKLMTSQVVQWPLLQMPTKVGFSTKRFNSMVSRTVSCWQVRIAGTQMICWSVVHPYLIRGRFEVGAQVGLQEICGCIISQ